MSTVGYEKSDVNIKATLGITLAITAFLVVSVIILNEYFLLETEGLIQKRVLEPESVALRELHNREAEQLTHYRLMDPQKNLYAVPIEHAMELLAQESFQKAVNRAK